MERTICRSTLRNWLRATLGAEEMGKIVCAQTALGQLPLTTRSQHHENP
jgi:hypothetical protein